MECLCLNVSCWQWWKRGIVDWRVRAQPPEEEELRGRRWEESPSAVRAAAGGGTKRGSVLADERLAKKRKEGRTQPVRRGIYCTACQYLALKDRIMCVAKTFECTSKQNAQSYFEKDMKPCGATKIEVDYFDIGHEIRMRWRRADSRGAASCAFRSFFCAFSPAAHHTLIMVSNF